MRKKMFQVFLAGIAAIAVTLSAQDDQALFDASIKQVDTGGVYLNYTNTRGMAESLKNIISFIINSSPTFNQNPEQIALAQDGLEVLLNLIHLDSYQAQATSAKSNQDGIFFYKSFLHTGTAQPQGIGFDLFSRTNQPLNGVRMIPKNAQLALGGYLEPGAVWNTLNEKFKKSENATLKQLPTMLEVQAEQKLKTNLSQLLKSISGEYFLLVTSAGTAEEPIIHVMLTLPDQDGILQKVLMENWVPSLKEISENVYAVSPPTGAPKWLAPQLIFEKGQVRLVSNPNILTEVSGALASGGALKATELNKYVKNIPTTGLNYFYLNIDEILVKAIAHKTGNDVITGIFKNKLPIMFGTTAIVENGYKSQLASNVSIHDTGIIVPAILAGTILPVLNKPRRMSDIQKPSHKVVACSSQLKQLSLGLKMYAMNNHHKFPITNNLDGVNELKTEKFKPELTQCPAYSGNDFSYYYLGGFKEEDFQDIPLMFDRPSNHPDYVNVLFLDGRVTTITIKNYQHPVQLIQQLHQEYKYSPELLEKLLKKCKEL